jgi:hypothetical protein
MLALLIAGGLLATQQVPLALDGLPRQTVEATLHGHAMRCEGVALVDLLRRAKAMDDAPLKGDALARLVVLTARDDYRVVFTLAEVDPTLGARRVFVVDRCDDKPLDPDTGPLRLLVPDDKRGARSLRQLDAIRVETLP